MARDGWVPGRTFVTGFTEPGRPGEMLFPVIVGRTYETCQFDAQDTEIRGCIRVSAYGMEECDRDSVIRELKTAAQQTGEMSLAILISEFRNLVDANASRPDQRERVSRVLQQAAVAAMQEHIDSPRPQQWPRQRQQRPSNEAASAQILADELKDLLDEQIAAGNPRLLESMADELRNEAIRVMRKRSRRMLRELSSGAKSNRTARTARTAQQPFRPAGGRTPKAVVKKENPLECIDLDIFS
jgi:hypothetical protein